MEILFGFILSKGKFLSKWKSKFIPNVDGPFWTVEKVNDNAYKVDLHKECNVLAIFNVKDLSPYLEDVDDFDLRSNHFQPGVMICII